jgi:hypothetical protein
MILNDKGRPIASEEKRKAAMEDLQVKMDEAKKWFAEHGYSQLDLLNVGINLVAQTVMTQEPQDLQSCQQRAFAAMQILETCLAENLQLLEINLKVRASLEAVNSGRTPS